MSGNLKMGRIWIDKEKGDDPSEKNGRNKGREWKAHGCSLGGAVEPGRL